ncbi:MAG TPA: 50S ribosomal protein L32 [Coriobacteriia bacterium]|nr:50S ribosomal protein L32 [Coriobacteriia bacterium]
MPVPKRKTSRSVRDARRATHAIEAPGLAVCPQCHQPKLPHRVCAECGYYKGKEVIDTQ